MNSDAQSNEVVPTMLGLPQDPSNDVAQNITNQYDNSYQPAPVSNAQSWWDKIKSFDREAGAWLIKMTKDDYNLLKEATGTVVGDVSAPVVVVANNAYWKIILAVVVIGGVIYFAGKSGAVKTNVII